MKNIFLVLAITTILILGVCVPIKACYVGEVAVVVCPDGSISTGMAEYDADCGFLNLKKRQIAQEMAELAAAIAIAGC